ncbi:DUF2059 domain-containing protein [Chitiniphilus eburneus]|uniref:DUF2059 domain-containing protein n=1 Tax=Chitiniphilus eburneus TaxID=2571148 RepID=A0A4V5MRF7_9NEIS|nr:DUF2059 domain-containing protein [Chitiniphilus eburneus]
MHCRAAQRALGGRTACRDEVGAIAERGAGPGGRHHAQRIRCGHRCPEPESRGKGKSHPAVRVTGAEAAPDHERVPHLGPLKPDYIKLYRDTFTQEEIDGLIAFYKTPAGQALVDKMPLVLQNISGILQSRLVPMMGKVATVVREATEEFNAQQQTEEAQ